MTSVKTFERGDRVGEKGGGPVMTVQTTPDHMAYCVWFENQIPNEGTFDCETLELVSMADV